MIMGRKTIKPGVGRGLMGGVVVAVALGVSVVVGVGEDVNVGVGVRPGVVVDVGEDVGVWVGVGAETPIASRLINASSLPLWLTSKDPVVVGKPTPATPVT